MALLCSFLTYWNRLLVIHPNNYPSSDDNELDAPDIAELLKPL